jgi:hypothetical protein
LANILKASFASFISVFPLSPLDFFVIFLNCL